MLCNPFNIPNLRRRSPWNHKFSCVLFFVGRSSSIVRLQTKTKHNETKIRYVRHVQQHVANTGTVTEHVATGTYLKVCRQSPYFYVLVNRLWSKFLLKQNLNSTTPSASTYRPADSKSDTNSTSCTPAHLDKTFEILNNVLKILSLISQPSFQSQTI